MKLFSNRSNGFTIRVLVQKLFGSLPLLKCLWLVGQQHTECELAGAWFKCTPQN